MESVAFTPGDKATRYRELVEQLAALFEDEDDLVANLANAAAAIRACVEKASWVGFYIMKGYGLVLGPFQGNVACVRIAMGKGVCGTAAAQRRTVIVPDVSKFPGHIACDGGTQSEIVIPIRRDGQVVAVLDLDSYELAAFDDIDSAGLAPVADLLGKLAWGPGGEAPRW
jgi:L-methionine (R)-S-oxide reductase